MSTLGLALESIKYLTGIYGKVQDAQKRDQAFRELILHETKFNISVIALYQTKSLNKKGNSDSKSKRGELLKKLDITSFQVMQNLHIMDDVLKGLSVKEKESKELTEKEKTVYIDLCENEKNLEDKKVQALSLKDAYDIAIRRIKMLQVIAELELVEYKYLKENVRIKNLKSFLERIMGCLEG
jgi:hypothetical protein